MAKAECAQAYQEGFQAGYARAKFEEGKTGADLYPQQNHDNMLGIPVAPQYTDDIQGEEVPSAES